MKHLLVLGASCSLVPLIRAAKGLGAYVSVASIPGDYPGFAEADEACYADITNPEEILALAERIGADAVATCCMDVGLRAQGRVVSGLGLKGPSYETVTLCTNKYLMKEAFLKAGVRTPRSIRVSSEKELMAAAKELRWPLITKAVDQMGSRGIYVCRTRDDLLENFQKSFSFTKEPYCLVEEFIEGELFGVEGMVKDGELIFALPDGTIAYQGFTPTPIGHFIPSEELMAVEPAIRKEVESVVRALGIDHAPFNCDLILSKDGVPYVIEATARAGATCLPELIGLRYGVNYYEQIARLALGMDLSERLGKQIAEPACLSYMLHSEKDGRLTRADFENASHLAGVQELTLNVKTGDTVRKYSNGRDGLGQVIISGGSLAECKETLDRVLSQVHLEVQE